MSEGERVVFERVHKDHVEQWDYYGYPGASVLHLNASPMRWKVNPDGPHIYRRIPDPVPALQAEIERLNADSRDSDILFGRGWQKTLASVGRDFAQFDQAQRLELAAKNEELQARIAELEGLLRLCEREGDGEPKTANDVLSVLSSYIADFMPPDSIPGDEYFAAWERQARVVIEPLFQRIETLEVQAAKPCVHDLAKQFADSVK